MAPSSRSASRSTTRSAYQCAECGWQTAKWVGRCAECQAWGSVVEQGAPRSRVQAGPVTSPARPIGEVPVEDTHSRTSGVEELDRDQIERDRDGLLELVALHDHRHAASLCGGRGR